MKDIDPDVSDRINVDRVSKELCETLVMLTEAEAKMMFAASPPRTVFTHGIGRMSLQPADFGESTTDGFRSHVSEGRDRHRELDLPHCRLFG